MKYITKIEYIFQHHISYISLMSKVFVPFQQSSWEWIFVWLLLQLLEPTARYIIGLFCDNSRKNTDESFNKYTSTLCKTVSAAAITRIHIYAL